VVTQPSHSASARAPMSVTQDAELAAALDAHYPDIADYLRAPTTTLVHVSLPSLFPTTATLYRIYYSNPYHPIVFMVGLVDGVAFPLTGHPERFAAFAHAAGVAIETAEAACDYARAFLETTRPAGRRFVVVSALDDLAFLPHPDDDDRASIAAFKRDFGELLRPPVAVADGAGFCVTLLTICDQVLQRQTLTVARNGGVDAVVATLAEQLPLVEGG
jgi:hypothetical protein